MNKIVFIEISLFLMNAKNLWIFKTEYSRQSYMQYGMGEVLLGITIYRVGGVIGILQ